MLFGLFKVNVIWALHGYSWVGFTSITLFGLCKVQVGWALESSSWVGFRKFKLCKLKAGWIYFILKYVLYI
jgi:hypothetical protein